MRKYIEKILRKFWGKFWGKSDIGVGSGQLFSAFGRVQR